MAYKDKSQSNIGWLAVVGILSIIVGFVLAGFIPEDVLSFKNKQQQQAVQQAAAPQNQTQVSPQVIQQTNSEERTPVILDISSPEFNNSKGTYSLVVRASVPSQDQLIYRIKDKSQSVVAENTSGVFSGITSSLDGGRYYVEVVNAAYPDMSSGLRTVSGFDVKMEVIPTVAKVTKSELTSKFNTGSYSAGFSGAWERDHLAPGCSFAFSGIKDGEPKPGDIGAICSRIQMGT